MALSDIVSVSITRQTRTPSTASFNDIMIVAEFLAASTTPPMGEDERVLTFNTIDEVSTAGFATTSDVYLAASAIFSQNPRVGQIKVGRKLIVGDGTETWTAALTAVNVYDPEWYGLVACTRTLADQKLVVDWVEAQTKICAVSSGDANILDSSSADDIALYIETSSLARSTVIYHPESDLTSADEFPDAAWLGKMFTYDPGQASWKFKTLAGVSSYSLTPTKRSAVLGKNANIYTVVSGVAITEDGTDGEGEFLDIIRGTDWLKSRIQDLIYAVLLNNPKVPFTDGGIQAVVGAISGQLQDAVNKQFLLPGFTIQYPLASEVSATDKGNRNLPDITFIAQYAGAIHSVELTGTISL